MLGLQAVLLPVVAIASSPLITSSVKLRVDAPDSHDWGSGTIIDTRQGEALILTCGHIFRKSQGQGNIEVHLFGKNSVIKVLGTCLFYDSEEMDLALVAIAPPCPVHAVPIAPVSYQILPSQQVSSVGCDHGGNPTVQTHQIISIDRVGTPRDSRVPFHYVQVSGAPVGGRSGGGLFSNEGYLIGVCNTGGNDGLFVPTNIIRHVLDSNGLDYVYKNPSLAASMQHDIAQHDLSQHDLSQHAPALAALTPLTPLESVEIPPTAAPALPAPMFAAEHNVSMSHNIPMSKEEQATLEEIKRRKQDGDEVILIVRSRRNPEVRSEIFVLSGQSDTFLDALVKNTPQPPQPANNPVILSSERQPASFTVRH